MAALLFLLALSFAGLVAGLLVPELSDLLLLAGPCVLASVILLIKTRWGSRRSQGAVRPRIILDGSNIMHWKGAGPDVAAVKDAIQLLSARGYVPGVVFDANVGYKLFDRYQGDAALAKLLGLPRDQVIVVARGTPADEVILAAARDYKARVVSNDRYRDWHDQHPEVADGSRLMRGGYRAGQIWLDLPNDEPH